MSEQPAAIPLPRYTPAYVYTCPDCSGDLTNEGVCGYWCAPCPKSFLFSEVVLEGDPGDD